MIEKRKLKALLSPMSIAVVGATDRLQYGGRLLSNLIKSGYEGTIYPVNPNRSIVQGMPCYPTLLDIPESVDCAAIVVPSHLVPEVLQQAVEKKIPSAVIISAGFNEQGTQEGKRLEEEIKSIAAKGKIAVCGPNCLGITNISTNSWISSVSWLDALPLGPGNLGVISQSGATAFGPVAYGALDRGIGLKYLISSGNESVLDTADYIEFMAGDPDIHAILAVLEGIRDGNRFREGARMAAAAGKPLIVLKSGTTEIGSKAAATHTSAMAGDDRIVNALFKQMGIVRVTDYAELCEVGNFFAKVQKPLGKRAGVISHSGGISGLVSDRMAEQGFLVPTLSPSTLKDFGQIMQGRGSATNPADLTGVAFTDELSSILRLFDNDPNIDFIVLATAGDLAQSERIVTFAEHCSKPIFMLWTGSRLEKAALPLLKSSQRLPVFYEASVLSRCAAANLQFHKVRERLCKEEWNPNPLKSLEGSSTILSGSESGQLLAQWGLKLPDSQLCRAEEEAVQAANQIGYPVAAKIVSTVLTHKSDVGGVKLGIQSPYALRQTYQEMMALDQRYGEGAVQGLLVQQMISGLELILGIKRDEQFGPVVLLGWGGIWAEAFQKVALRVCPISEAEGEELVDEVEGLSKILAGYRGQGAYDRKALIQSILQLSRGALERLDVQSIDINPLVILPEGSGTLSVDARVEIIQK